MKFSLNYSPNADISYYNRAPISASMAAELSGLVQRLEAVTARLEGMSAKGGSVGGAGEAGERIFMHCIM